MGILFDDADILAILKLGGTEEFNRELEGVNSRVKEGAQNLSMAVDVGIAAGAAALGLAVTNAAKFEQAMANVNTIVGLDKGALANMAEGVKTIAMNTNVDFTSLTDGLYDLVSSGVPANDAVGALALSAQAASAGLAGVNVAVQAGMANINAYGLPISELTKVLDLQFQAVNIGVTTYGELATAIGNVLPAANNLKVPLDQLYGAVAQLTLSGIDPQSTTTYLGRLFSELSNPEKIQNFVDAGIQIFGEDGTFRGLVDILIDVNEVVKDMTPEQRASFFEGLGFTEQSNKAMLALIANLEGETGFLRTMEKMADAPGAVNRAFKIQNETFASEAGKFKNIVQTSFIDVGNALTPVLSSITQLATSNPEATRTFAASIGTLAIGFAGIAGAYKGIMLLQTMFSALALSPIGAIGLAMAGVAAGIVAIQTAVSAQQESAITKIGATSDDIEKVGQLADTIEILRGRTQLTKEESKALHDQEKLLGEMLGSVGLNVDDYAGKLGTVKDVYKDIREFNLLQQLEDLEKKVGTEGGILSGLGAGLAAIAPSLGNMFTDQSVGRAGDLADRIQKIKDEIAELNKPASVDQVTTKINKLADAAGGDEKGKGGASKKIKVLSDSLSYKDDGLTLNLRGVGDAAADIVTPLEDVEIAVENSGQAVKDKNQNWADYAGYLEQIIGRMSGGNEHVKNFMGLFTSMTAASFDPVATGFNAINLVMGFMGGDTGTVKLASREISAMKDTLGEMYEPTMKAKAAIEALNAQFESDKVTQLQQEQDMLAKRIDYFERMGAAGADTAKAMGLYKQLESVNKEIDKLTGAFTEKESFETATSSLDYLVENTQTMFDTFGKIDNPGLAELLQEAVDSSGAWLDKVNPTSEAYKELVKNLEKAKDLLDKIGGAPMPEAPEAPEVPGGPEDPEAPSPTPGGDIDWQESFAEGGYVDRDMVARLHANEFVLNRESLAALGGSSSLTRFSESLNPSELVGARSQPAAIINIIAGNTTPETWFRVSDKHIQPRIDQRTRRYQVQANPYAQ